MIPLPAILALWLVQAPAAGQPQVRDASANRPSTGRARIAGMVTDDTGTPLERAQVLLVGESAERSRTAVTGDDGRYAFADLPAGSFRITVSKAGFRLRQYGQPSEGLTGRLIRVTDAARFTANITLPRGAAVAGVVTDETGAPLPYAQVAAWRSTYRDGRPGVDTVSRRAADSHGRYRLFGLPPGELVIGVEHPRQSTPPASTVKVAVRPGDERFGVDLTRPPAIPTGNVKVSVHVPGGMAAQSYRVTLRDRDDPSISVDRYVDTAPFDLRDVPAGAWNLLVTARLSNADAGPRAIGAFYWTLAPLTVDGGGVTELGVELQPGMTVSGRVVFDGTRPQPSSRVYLTFSRTDLPRGHPANASFSGQTDRTGAFIMREAFPGSYILEQGGVDGWRLKSLEIDGRDVTDSGLTIAAGRDITGVVVTFTDRVTAWTGTVRDAAGSPAPDCVLVVYPSNEASWVRRRIAAVQPASDGTFAVRGLPPGRYRVAAVSDVEPDRWFDPAFLRTLTPVLSLTLTDEQALSGDVVRVR